VYAIVLRSQALGKPVTGRNVRAQPGLTTQMAPIDLSPSSLKERARRTARGSLPPAGVDAEAAHAGLDGRQRRAIRQRLRRTRAMRRARVAELGALVADMQGRGRWNQTLVDRRAGELERADRELANLELALRGQAPLAFAGVVECGTCGRLAGATDKHCTGCGRELSARTAPAPGETGGTGTTARLGTDATVVGDLTTIR
jgi:hypothetical protein